MLRHRGRRRNDTESTFRPLLGTLGLARPERAHDYPDHPSFDPTTTAAVARRTATRSPAELERRYGAANYHPLPVTLERGAGVWLFDTDGRRHLDMMSAYSAVSFGHGHPALVRVLDRAGRSAWR